ncbi:LOW QUALITY PROTEIN: butyrophilin subfamily 1 member A1-like [Anomalospiza imberbis]|uniref:LOW QUALITY PROTEIN: butyrophilin subfamily 1 member A1-like n=1 Tax=Anomalospiza imberbis TaxID=187417 RepID=UPI00358DF1C3
MMRKNRTNQNQNQIPFYPKTGGFLSAPKIPILGIIGDRVVLPCQVGSRPIPEDFSIRWTFHGQSQRIPVYSYDGKGWGEEPDERYRGRAELFHGEFRAGNVSLLLRDVRSSDQGSYGCQVSFQDESREVLVELEVAAVGEAPSVILRGPEKQDLGLSCRASGWFPQPELLWLDGHGNVRREPTATTATVSAGGLFSVEGSVWIQPGADLEISCRVLNHRLNASRASRIRIHEALLPSTSRWLQIFLAVLFLNLALISLIFCVLQRSHKRTVRAGKAKLEMEEEKRKMKALLGQLTAELDFWEARSHAAPVALDPEARPLPLGDARDPLPVAALVARAALGAGKGYWEVELGQQRSWALGVLRDPPDARDPRDPRDLRHPRHPHDPRDPPRLWALCASRGRLFSVCRALGEHPRDLSVLGEHPRDLSVLGEHPRDLSVLGEYPRDLSVLGEHPRDLSVLGEHRRDLSRPRDLSVAGERPRDLSVLGERPRDLSVLGVLLDREKARLEFYDAERREPLAGIALEDPAGTFFPFVSRGEEGALRLRPVPLPVPLPAPVSVPVPEPVPESVPVSVPVPVLLPVSVPVSLPV